MGPRILLTAHLSHTAFSVESGREAGLLVGRMRGVDLRRAVHGVRSSGLRSDDLMDRCTEVEVVMRPDQAFSHLTAARLLGMPLPRFFDPRDPLDVLSMRGGRMRRPGVIGPQTGRPDTRVVMVAHLPVVGPADTWCHLAALPAVHALTREWLVAAGDFLISGTRTTFGRQRPLCSVEDLEAAARRHAGDRGAAAITWALPHLRSPVDSPRESLLRLGLVAAGLPEPTVQPAIPTAAGLRHPDLGYLRERVLLEYQGDEHRTDARRWRQDLTRVQLFEDAGYRVILVGSDDVLPAGMVDLAARVSRALTGRRFEG